MMDERQSEIAAILREQPGMVCVKDLDRMANLPWIGGRQRRFRGTSLAAHDYLHFRIFRPERPDCAVGNDFHLLVWPAGNSLSAEIHDADHVPAAVRITAEDDRSARVAHRVGKVAIAELAGGDIHLS